MKKIILLTIVASLAACGGNEEAEQAAAETAAQLQQAGAQAAAAAAEAAAATPTEAPAAVPAEAAGGPAAPAAAPAAGDSNFGTITLGPGFMPDPSTAQGTSGGSINASTLNGACMGNISGTPDHLFVASGAFSNLRIMAHSDTDITLVIQKPDGTYTCDDDTENTDPVVDGEFAPGTYKIWIGSYDASNNGSYTLGITELTENMPSSL